VGKIYEHVCKIPEILGKLPEHTASNGAQHCLILINWRPTWGESHEDRFFGGHARNDLCGRKYSHKELPKKFSAKFGEIRAKIFGTPKNLSAPTPM